MTVLPLHLGALHPVELVLTLLLAVGPFLVLGVVVAVRRRQDSRIEPGGPRAGPGEDEPAQRER